MGHLVNKKTLAAIFGLTERTITNYQQQGLPGQRGEKRGQANSYDTEEVFNWLLDRKTVGNPIDEEMIDTEQERGRLARAQADAKELDNAERRKELAPVELLEWVLAKTCSQISAVLETIPLNVKRRVPKLGANGIELIKREIVKCQNLAAGAVIDLDEFSEDTESDTEGT